MRLILSHIVYKEKACSCLLLLLFFTFTSYAQVISRFTWNTNPVTLADVGPNATSVGLSATSSPGGVGGTNGLNPGLPKSDVNLIIPNTGGIFDVPSIDVSIDYMRRETVSTLFKRGSFTFNAGNSPSIFQVVYRVDNGTAVGQTITGGSYSVPIDNVFRNFRFTYDNCSGIGTMYVNNVSVWTSSATPGQNLYWAGDGNLLIGQHMDGSGANVPTLDNFMLSSYTCILLPVQLISFTGKNEGTANRLTWLTASETNADFFTLQRSSDGFNWYDLKQIPCSGTSMVKRTYDTYDQEPATGVNYYRLTQTDLNGKSEAFGIVSIDNTTTKDIKVIRVADLLGRTIDESDEGVKLIYYSDGQVIKKVR